jgi:hypothetical protein
VHLAWLENLLSPHQHVRAAIVVASRFDHREEAPARPVGTADDHDWDLVQHLHAASGVTLEPPASAGVGAIPRLVITRRCPHLEIGSR